MTHPVRTLYSLLLAALVAAACGSPQSQEIRRVDPPPDETSETDPPDEDPTATTDELVMSEAPCETDADCVPNGCCHPTACIAAADATDCLDVHCTADCRAGTLDCGGACLCHEGRCAARLWQPEDLQVAE